MKQTNLKTARPESPLYGPMREASVATKETLVSPRSVASATLLGEASYFSIAELTASASAERLAIDNTPPRAARKMLTILVEQLLDPIRRRYGAPIIVTSGYRCPALNTAVGGVANSHHIVGCAADIVGGLPPPPPTGGGHLPPNRYLYELIIQMQREGCIRFTQLIAEEGYRWLHISYVPGMLRNQVINVNDNVNVDDNQPSGRQLTSSLSSSLEKESTSASTSKIDYQDSG